MKGETIPQKIGSLTNPVDEELLSVLRKEINKYQQKTQPNLSATPKKIQNKKRKFDISSDSEPEYSKKKGSDYTENEYLGYTPINKSPSLQKYPNTVSDSSAAPNTQDTVFNDDIIKDYGNNIASSVFMVLAYLHIKQQHDLENTNDN